MKLTVTEDKKIDEIYVRLVCPTIDQRVKRLVLKLRLFDNKIPARHEKETYLLAPDDIYYLESVNKHTFLYTRDRVFESSSRLYEMEDYLCDFDFVRISKQMILNFDKVCTIKPDLNARLRSHPVRYT